MSDLHYTDALDREITLRKQNGSLNELIISLFRGSYFIQPNATRFAILGDLHGHITQALTKLENWNKYSNLKIDAILQVGDLGVMNDRTTLDAVTLDISKKDPEELGFKKYYYGSKEADYFFGSKGIFSEIPFYFINGNHDDMKLLDTESSKNHVGHYKNIQYIPDGEIIQIKNIKIGALGYFHNNANAKKMNANILLTHCFFNTELLNPEYTFFGHSNDAVSQTVEYKNQFGLNETGKKFKRGTMGFLEMSDKNSQFIYLPDQEISSSES